jgi:predicted choloylglycine hydrolase
MFGFGNKKEDPNRKALREEFETATTALRSADHIVQVAVGHSINMASSIFHQRFSSPSEFQQIPKSERFAYLNKLTDMENKLRDENNDPYGALGFGLFKMWVGAVTELDTDLMQQFSNELAYFSKKGNLGL